MPLTVAEAVAAVVGAAAPLEAERVGSDAVRGRVLAADVTSPVDLPPFHNSAMDGYAVRAGDTAGASDARPRRLRIAGESRAGAPAPVAVGTEEAVGVSTGAVLPAGADAVVRVEDTRDDGDGWVQVHREVPVGADIRPAGDDIRAGEVVLRAGTPVGAGERALLVSIGALQVAVHRSPRVAIVATGSELVPPGSPLGPGQIVDSNGVMLADLVGAHGGVVVRTAAGVADRRDATREALAAALDGCDVLVISGGVSMGAHDHVRPSLDALGVEERYWRIALRPGHPVWFGARDARGGRTLVFGLPGNPVSAYVTFQLLVVPALMRLAGLPRTDRPVVDARYDGDAFTKASAFTHAVRCRLDFGDGPPRAIPTAANQRSHALSSLVGVDALALVPPGIETVRPGDPVRALMVADGHRVDIGVTSRT